VSSDADVDDDDDGANYSRVTSEIVIAGVPLAARITVVRPSLSDEMITPQLIPALCADTARVTSSIIRLTRYGTVIRSDPTHLHVARDDVIPSRPENVQPQYRGISRYRQ